MPCHAPVRRHSWTVSLVSAVVALEGFVAAAAEPGPRLLEAEHGVVCRLPGERFSYFGWPTVARMDDGRLFVVSSGLRSEHVCPFGKTVLHESEDDGGATWSVPRWLGFKGSPPHLLRHSSGPLVMTYGYRNTPFGQRVAISRDDGKSWQADWVLRGDGPDGDLGYPSTVELADGTLLTVCYQKAAKGEKCSLLWSEWKLPAPSPGTLTSRVAMD